MKIRWFLVSASFLTNSAFGSVIDIRDGDELDDMPDVALEKQSGQIPGLIQRHDDADEGSAQDDAADQGEEDASSEEETDSTDETDGHGESGEEPEDLPWYVSASSYHFPHVFATDLEQFVPQLNASTADYVLIDFYAPWCPHCQHFAPDYERLALAIQRFDAAVAKNRKYVSKSATLGLYRKPTSILSATVDCVRFADLCNFWGVQSYPTLMFGTREDFIKKIEAKGTNFLYIDHISSIDTWDGTAESVASWIKNHTQLSLDIANISKREIRGILQAYAPTPRGRKQINAHQVSADLWDAQLGTALLLRQIFSSHYFELPTSGSQGSSVKDAGKYASNTTTSSFFNFLGLLGKRFPSGSRTGSCRESINTLSHMLHEKLYDFAQEVQDSHTKAPSAMINPDEVERDWSLCSTDWGQLKDGWHQCKGTWPGKRGFTCGLWTLFHFLAARSTDAHAQSELEVVRSTIAHFFDCEECRDHFMKIPAPQRGVKFTRKDAVVWWWNAHNAVNRRVQKLEEMYDDGDPGFPKAQWPTEAECPKCRRKALSAPTARLRGKDSSSTKDQIIFSQGRASVSSSPSRPSQEAEAQVADVPIEKVTLAEAVAEEHWDLDEVVKYLDSRYLSSEL